MAVRIDLDSLREGIDRALDSPWGRIAQELFPRAAAEVRAARDALPTMAADAHDRLAAEVRGELDALEAEAIDGVKRAWRGLTKPRKGRRR